jgi:hypothetical protein
MLNFEYFGHAARADAMQSSVRRALEWVAGDPEAKQRRRFNHYICTSRAGRKCVRKFDRDGPEVHQFSALTLGGEISQAIDEPEMR